MKGGYSVVIATCDRDEPLARVLEDWSAQTAPPEKVVVTGADAPGRNASAGGGDEANVTRLVSPVRSAARQRNLGAEVVETEWIVFCDDDVRFAPDLAAVVLEFLAAHPEAVAVSPRMRGASHPRPGRWLRRYYGLQAGFPDGTYGGRLFGAGITCYPCWDIQPEPVEANWLPSTMLWMKAAAFRRHRFPDFEGYSFGEDAHLTHRVWRDAEPAGRKLYFLGAPEFDHLSIQSGVKADRFRLGRMVVRNQKCIAREAMGKGAWEVFWKSFVHRMFVTAALIKGRRSGWVGEMIGLWSA